MRRHDAEGQAEELRPRELGAHGLAKGEASGQMSVSGQMLVSGQLLEATRYPGPRQIFELSGISHHTTLPRSL